MINDSWFMGRGMGTTVTRSLPALSVRAALEPKTVDEEARTVEVVWTTGAKVLRGWYDQYWEELSLDPAHVKLDRLNNGAPLLFDHDDYRVADTPGVVVPGSAKIVGNEGRATVRFARAGLDARADMLFEKVKDGIVQNVSVGYRINKMELVETGTDQIPVYRATDWQPFEISAVAMGADDGAGFRSEKDSRSSNQCVFVTRKETEVMTIKPKDQKPPASDVAEETAPAEARVATPAVEDKAAEQRGVELERARIAGLDKVTSQMRALGFDADALKADHVAKSTTVEDFRALALEELAKHRSKNDVEIQAKAVIEVGDSDEDKFARKATALLLSRSSPTVRSNIEQATAAGKISKIETDVGDLRGLSIPELARECLERRGVKTRGMDKMTLMGRAFTQRSGGFHGISDFPVLFENLMNKVLLSAYATVPDTWRAFCKVEQVPDFRDQPRYRAASLTVLDSKTEAGEYKNKTIPDGQKTVINVATKGNIIAITREAMINDDMGALSDLMAKLGRAAALSIESDVYALLNTASGLGPNVTVGSTTAALFDDTAWGNVGTGAALSVASLDADRVKMAQQRDVGSNEFLSLRPQVLVLPIGLGGQARIYNQSQFDADASNKYAVPNKVVGLFSQIIDTPRLSGTRRYMFADPNIAPAIVVAFLEGQGEGPVLDSKEGWRVDGNEMRVRIDYKVQPFDPKGALTNAGA